LSVSRTIRAMPDLSTAYLNFPLHISIQQGIQTGLARQIPHP
jgi:hypothetical protein